VHRFIGFALASLTVFAAPAAVHSQTAKHRTTKPKVVAQPVAATVNWQNVYYDDTVAVAIDPVGTQVRKDGTYQVHLRWTYNTDQPIGRNKFYRTMTETRLVDCDKKRTKPISAETRDVNGKHVSSYTTREADLAILGWTTRKRGSASAHAYTKLCQAITQR